MDVRLDVQALGMAPRQAAVPKGKDDAVDPELVKVQIEEEKVKAEEPQFKTAEPPKVISKEELFQFLLMLVGSPKDTEESAQGVHDPQRMRNALLAGKS